MALCFLSPSILRPRCEKAFVYSILFATLTSGDGEGALFGVTTSMPMMMITCRFDDSAPSRNQIDKAIERQLGQRKLDSIEIEGPRVRLLSMSAVPLVYAHKACVELGATSVDTEGASRQVEWPEWSERPWTDHGPFAKLKITFSRFSL